MHLVSEICLPNDRDYPLDRKWMQMRLVLGGSFLDFFLLTSSELFLLIMLRAPKRLKPAGRAMR